ncbi:MAG: methyl-accepting chemotaxis sensory transducer [Deferribacteraceae bacterium]|jgi:twitching motility protein PilJ|nr:methyl-accepting chemotaxis sensory transducer [Deferribacteraceae bacterium]
MAERGVKFSLLSKIVLLLLVVIALVSFTASYIVYSNSVKTEVKNILEDLTTRVDGTFKRIEDKDKEVGSIIRTFTISPLLKTALQGKVKQSVITGEMDRFLSTYTDVSSVYLVDLDYNIIGEASKKEIKLPPLDEIIYYEDLKLNEYYVESYLTKETPYVVYYSPVGDENGIYGALVAVVDGNYLLGFANSEFTKMKFHEAQRSCANCHTKEEGLINYGFTVVYDADGNLVLNPLFGDRMLYEKKPEFTALFNEIKPVLKVDKFIEKEVIVQGQPFFASFGKLSFKKTEFYVGMLKNKNYKLASIQKGGLFSIGITAVLALIIFLVTIVLMRRSLSPVFELNNAMQRVMEGEYDIRVASKTSDELGSLAEGFNEMLDRISGYIQTDEDRKRLQNQAINLMDVVSEAAEGNLTVEAEVTADELGAVADAFNMMTGNIRELINDIKSAGDSIVDATEKLLMAAEKTSEGANIQIEELNKTYEVITVFKKNSQASATKSEETVEVTASASEAAEKGLAMLDETVDAMLNVKRYSQLASKKVKSLGERSLEIGDITNVISEISNQTNLLALNAAIEAARAGEYGHGFAVVADEIRKLAERSTKATKEIAELIKSIQVETSETVKLVEESTVNIEHSSDLAEKAGKSLKDINEALVRARDSIREISLEIINQAEEANNVAVSIEKVREIAEGTVEGVKQTNMIVATLSQLAEMFKEAVDKFRV